MGVVEDEGDAAEVAAVGDDTNVVAEYYEVATLPGGEVIGVGGERLGVTREINLEIGSAAEVNIRVGGGDLVGVRCLLDVGGNQ